jgi:hypothetical protein
MVRKPEWAGLEAIPLQYGLSRRFKLTVRGEAWIMVLMHEMERMNAMKICSDGWLLIVSLSIVGGMTRTNKCLDTLLPILA